MSLLLHVTTVPMSLRFLRGQPAFMRQRLGMEVGAVSSPGEELEAFSEREGARGWSVPMERRITPGKDLVALARLVRLLRRLRPDIVHSHTPKGGLLGMMAAAAAGVPCRVYHMHGLPMETARGTRRLLLRLSERVSCALAHRVYCVSGSLRSAAIAEGLVPAEKARVLAGGSINGVDAGGEFAPDRHRHERRPVRARFSIPPDAVVVGFVGRIVRDKGVVELAEAWRALREASPNVHLLLVGPTEAEDAVPEAVLQRLREDERVHWAGLDWNIAPLMAAMDLLVLPTYREGLPVVLLEAAAMGLPVVATRSTGCVDVVRDGETGALVPVGDVEALAAALQRYVASAPLREVHGRAARDLVRLAFSREVIHEALAAEYSALLAERGDGRARRWRRWSRRSA